MQERSLGGLLERRERAGRWPLRHWHPREVLDAHSRSLALALTVAVVLAVVLVLSLHTRRLGGTRGSTALFDTTSPVAVLIIVVVTIFPLHALLRLVLDVLIVIVVVVIITEAVIVVVRVAVRRVKLRHISVKVGIGIIPLLIAFGFVVILIALGFVGRDTQQCVRLCTPRQSNEATVRECTCAPPPGWPSAMAQPPARVAHRDCA